MQKTEKNMENFLKEKERLEAENNQTGKKVIVNAGLLKAGKSTLFNSLAGKESFKTDVVRATTENSKIELDGYYLIDTPGLDAVDKDTETALEGYAEADLIIFVHNMQEGELNQVEVDSIRQICGVFGSDSEFFENTIIVLTHKDQMHDHHEEIKKRIEEQCKNIFNHQFKGSFCVDSVSYLKGVAKGKELLKSDSGIPELLKMIDNCVLQDSTLQKARFEKRRAELLAEMEENVTLLQKSMPKEDVKPVSDMQKAEKEIRHLVENTIKSIQNQKIEWPASGSYKWCGQAQNYKDYDSSYDAELAAKKAISDAVKETAKAVKRKALSFVECAEKHINLSKVPKDIVDKISAVYEKIRRNALQQGMTIKTNFTVTLRDPADTEQSSKLEKAKEEIARLRDSASYIST